MQVEEQIKTRRIRQISVKNLFGIFNHVIPMKMDDRITIIHGPNGFGKTMLLKLLHALFTGKNSPLRDIPFDELRVDFEDQTSFWVTKTSHLIEASEEEQLSPEQEIIFHATGKAPYRLSLPPSSKESKSDLLRKPFPIEISISHDIRHNINIRELPLDSFMERFSDQLLTELRGKRTDTPEWLVEIRKSVPVIVIETQRLLNINRRSEYEKKNSLGLHSVLGTSKANDVKPESLERSLRLAFEKAYFHETNLFMSIRQWEEENKPFVILAS